MIGTLICPENGKKLMLPVICRIRRSAGINRADDQGLAQALRRVDGYMSIRISAWYPGV